MIEQDWAWCKREFALGGTAHLQYVMYTYMCTYAHIYKYTHMYTRICVHTGMCAWVCVCMWVCVCVGVHLDVMYTYINVNKYIYAYTHVCIHKYMYINVYKPRTLHMKTRANWDIAPRRKMRYRRNRMMTTIWTTYSTCTFPTRTRTMNQ